MWPILQSLIQLQAHYKTTWETFVANSTIRQFFSINHNLIAEYVSAAIGNTSHVITTQDHRKVITNAEANQRQLVTPDDLRRASGNMIFAFIAAHSVTYYAKQPYYEVPRIIGKADKNPYIG